MSWTNFHGHCKYCDGVLPPVDYVKSAAIKGFLAYGFSSHGPVNFPSHWNIKNDNIERYLNDVDLVKDAYLSSIEVYKGFEADFVPGQKTPIELKTSFKLDYTIGSIHYVDQLTDGTPWEIDGPYTLFNKGLKEIFDTSFKEFVKRYFDLFCEMIEVGRPDIIGHLDKYKIHNHENQYFDPEIKWYRKQIIRALDTIKKKDAILEVNTRGIYKNKTIETYPAPWILKMAHKKGIPIMLNSDAHHPWEIDMLFRETALSLKEIGFKTMRVLHNQRWNDIPFDENGLNP